MQSTLFNYDELPTILLLELDRPTNNNVIWDSSSFDKYLNSPEWINRSHHEVVSIATEDPYRQKMDFYTKMYIPDIACTISNVRIESNNDNKYLVATVQSVNAGISIPPFDFNTRHVSPKLLAATTEYIKNGIRKLNLVEIIDLSICTPIDITI